MYYKFKKAIFVKKVYCYLFKKIKHEFNLFEYSFKKMKDLSIKD